MGHPSRRSSSRSWVRGIVAAGLIACIVPCIAAQDGRTVEVLPEPATLEPDPYEAERQQRALHEWLTSETPTGVLANPTRITVTRADLDEVDRVDAADPGPTTVGMTKPVSLRVDFSAMRAADRARSFAGGELAPTADGGFVWAVALASEGASALRVHLQDVRLGPSADVYVHTPKGQAFGPLFPDEDGELWTTTVMGPVAILQVRQFGPPTAADLHSTGFRITDVGHIGPRFALASADKALCLYNVSCVENAECYASTDWRFIEDAQKAVAMMLWISGAFINTCSGGLLADTDPGSQIPYFLTANHCVSRGRDARSIDFFFDYTKPCSSGSCPPAWTGGGTQVGGGASIVATGSTGDYTLLRMSNNPPSGRVFMGWTTAPVANSNDTPLYRVSHPATAPQAFSSQTVDTSAPTCQGIPRGSWIYSRDVIGATEGGSSGSIVANAAGQVVGQLTGACGFNTGNPCDSASNATIDGAFASYFGAVESFLDPGTSCTPTTEVCSGGGDEDCDGAIDCADADCSGDPACSGGTCSQPGESCSSNSDCCSGKCKGPPSNLTCR